MPWKQLLILRYIVGGKQNLFKYIYTLYHIMLNMLDFINLSFHELQLLTNKKTKNILLMFDQAPSGIPNGS